MRLLLSWLINAVALLAVPHVVPGIAVDSFGAALVAALLLALVNTVLRPILVLLTLPVTIVTLGLFILVINGLLFWLVSSLVPGFHVHGLLAGVLGALLYSIVSWLIAALLIERRDE
jgi:putative membrane protein